MYVDDAATSYSAPNGGGAECLAIGNNACADGASSVVVGNNS